MFLTVLFIAALLMPASVSAQVFGGHITDYVTRRSAGAIQVEAIHDGSVVASTQTDTGGIFYLQVPRPGVYRLRIGAGTAAPFFTDTLRVAADGFVQGEYRLDSTGTRVYFPFEIAKQAAVRPGSAAPRYPDGLRRRRLEGEVLARFVVDTTGRALDSTFTVIRATDTAFVSAVRESFPNMRFFPAELSNHLKVRQYVYMPFQFAIGP